jgi:transposase
LEKGRSTSEVAVMTSFGERWIEQLVEHYNALGPSALGDQQRGDGASARVLKPELLQRLRERLGAPPPDRGVWTSGKAARWMASELGLASLAPRRSWEALRAIGWSMQEPRARDPKTATLEEQDAFKKSEVVAEGPARHPDTPLEALASDERRIGLKPVIRRIWAPIGERPIAHGHHRFEWLDVTAFVSPAAGESFWCISNGVSKPFFEAPLWALPKKPPPGASGCLPKCHTTGRDTTLEDHYCLVSVVSRPSAPLEKPTAARPHLSSYYRTRPLKISA